MWIHIISLIRLFASWWPRLLTVTGSVLNVSSAYLEGFLFPLLQIPVSAWLHLHPVFCILKLLFSVESTLLWAGNGITVPKALPMKVSTRHRLWRKTLGNLRRGTSLPRQVNTLNNMVRISDLMFSSLLHTRNLSLVIFSFIPWWLLNNFSLQATYLLSFFPGPGLPALLSLRML